MARAATVRSTETPPDSLRAGQRGQCGCPVALQPLPAQRVPDPNGLADSTQVVDMPAGRARQTQVVSDTGLHSARSEGAA
jgi:hypothetical protein